MIIVELDIFSGRPNPTWELSSAQIATFQQMVGDQNAPILSVDDGDHNLGYRGFILNAFGDDERPLARLGFPPEFRIRSAGGLSLSNEPEFLLLDSFENRLDDPGVVYDAVSEGILMPDPETAALLSGCFLYKSSSTDFSFWNGTRRHRRNNNCYNFASAYRTNTFAQPGRGGGDTMSFPPTARKLRRAARRDGYRPDCNGGSLKVAAVVWPGADFHFYRKTADSPSGKNRWSHKPGKSRARNKDNSGKFIKNPRKADRGPYTGWAGYLYSPGSSRSTVR